MKKFFAKNGPIISTYFFIAIGFWIIFLIIIPQLYMLDLVVSAKSAAFVAWR
jgi:hypothetical protein